MRILKAIFIFLTYPFHRGRYIIFLLLVSQLSHAQDSTRVKALERRIDLMQADLVKHQKQFNTGVSLQVAGLAIALISIPMAETSPEMATGISIVGGVSIVAGTIVTWISHKHIGNAGRRK